MLHVSEEEYRRILAEEQDYQALVEKETRRSLATSLRIRTWLTGAATLAFGISAATPRLRPMVVACVAMAPVFFWHAWQLLRLDRYLDSRIRTAAERRRLRDLEARRRIRMNMMEQKQAQDEIERLRAEIDAMRSSQEGAGT